MSLVGVVDIGSIDLWLARTFSVLVAFIALGVAYGAGVVFKVYYLLFKEEVATWRLLTPQERMCTAGVKPTFNTHGVVIVTVAVALECILWAILNVGEAFSLVVDGWGAIVGIIGTLILPLLGYKSIQSLSTTSKNGGGPTNVSSGGGGQGQ